MNFKCDLKSSKAESLFLQNLIEPISLKLGAISRHIDKFNNSKYSMWKIITTWEKAQYSLNSDILFWLV